MACKHCKHDNLNMALLPRELNLPEPFKSAVSHYFTAENVARLDWSQIEQLKKDMLNIALNLNDGNKTAAGRLLGLHRVTICGLIDKL